MSLQCRCCLDMRRGKRSDGNHLMLFRLQMVEAALALSEQKNHNLGELLTQVKVEKEEQLERWSREKKKELEARTKTSQAFFFFFFGANFSGKPSEMD